VVLRAIGDGDRRVRTEAVRALGTYTDASSLIQLILLLQDDDPWIAVSAAEGIAFRGDRGRAAIPELLKASGVGNSPDSRCCDHRAAECGCPPLAPATPCEGHVAHGSHRGSKRSREAQGGGRVGLTTLRNDPIARSAPLRLLRGCNSPTPSKTPEFAVRRGNRRLSRATSPGAAAARSIAEWADSSDIPTLLDAYAVALERQFVDGTGGDN
jgi:hypothetical protein